MRRRKPLQGRRRHPDPAVELQLQQILGLMDRCNQKSALIDAYRGEIAALHGQIRRLSTSNMYGGRIAEHDRRIARLQEQMRAIDAEIDAAREQVAKLQSGMDPNDLAYLWG